MVRVDLHLHSHYSNDGGWSSLQELVDRAGECQLDRIALTDHNTVEGALALVQVAPQLAIVGEEINTLEGEVIGLFITGHVPPFLAPEDAMDKIRGMGGLTYVPHPLDRRRPNFSPERIVELAHRIDIFETYNPWCDTAANDAAARLAAEIGLVTATGSDSHAAHELGRSWMELEEFDGAQDLLEKLRHARHVVTAGSGIGPRA
jgi:predicted metal-dependent phosphoesterase TrpH